MARRSPSHLKKDFIAQRVFTDREMPRKAFFDALSSSQTKDDNRILNFYGVGGQGKTALCEQFTKSLDKEKKKNKYLGWAKLDFEVSEQRSIANALLAIRLQLAAQCKIPFPAFDTAFARYFAFTRPGFSLNDVHPDLFKQPNDILQDVEGILAEVAVDVVKEIPGAGLFYKYTAKLSNFAGDWWNKRGKQVLRDLDELDQHKLVSALPSYLGADIYDWLFDEKAVQTGKKRRLVILLDTYEALWRDQSVKTGLEAMRIDAWVRDLVEETPGVMYLVLGRDQLNWSEVDEEWQADIESHLLGGLSKEDADDFLQKIPITESDVRTAIIDSAEGTPFYLDLQVDLYGELRQKNTHLSASNFGGKKKEVLARFTDHLDPHILRALQIVSHARFINEKLVYQLAEKFLGSKAAINLKQLISFSFWKQEGDTYYLHSLMLEYLQDRQEIDEPELFSDVHQFLFKIYDDKLDEIQEVVDIAESHKQALTEAGYHIQKFSYSNFPDWVDKRGEIFYQAYAWEQVEPLWGAVLEMPDSILKQSQYGVAGVLYNRAKLFKQQGKYKEVESLLKRCLDISENTLGEEHTSVANTLNLLASNYQLQGEFDAAEKLYKRSLSIIENILGRGDLEFAKVLCNLAINYKKQGKEKDAELFWLESIQLIKYELGPRHKEVATISFNLASLYQELGKYDEAKRFYLRALSIKKKILGDRHPEVSSIYSHLATVFARQKMYTKAEELYLCSISNMEDVLGKNNPLIQDYLCKLAAFYQIQDKYSEAELWCSRIFLMMEIESDRGRLYQAIALAEFLAKLYWNQSMYVKAEEMYRHTLDMQRKIQDGDQLLVGVTLHHLGDLCQLQNKDEDAESYYLDSLMIKRNILGAKNIEVAKTMNNLANLNKKQGKYEDAEQLYQDTFSIFEGELGRTHFAIVDILRNLADCYQKQNKYVMVAITMSILADCCEQQGKYNDAYSLFECSLTVLNESYPDGDKFIDQVQENFDSLKRKIN